MVISSELFLWLRAKGLVKGDWNPVPCIGDIWGLAEKPASRWKIVSLDPLGLSAHSRAFGNLRPADLSKFVAINTQESCLLDATFDQPLLARQALAEAVRRGIAPPGAKQLFETLAPFAPLKGDCWRRKSSGDEWKVYIRCPDEAVLGRRPHQKIRISIVRLLEEYSFSRITRVRNQAIRVRRKE